MRSHAVISKENKSITFGPKWTYTDVFQVAGCDQTDLLGDTRSVDFKTLSPNHKHAALHWNAIRKSTNEKSYTILASLNSSPGTPCLPRARPPFRHSRRAGAVPPLGGQQQYSHFTSATSWARLCQLGRPGSPQLLPIGKSAKTKSNLDFSWL